MTAEAPAKYQASERSLGLHFEKAFDVGVAIEPEDLSSDGHLIAHHFRRLTAENAMKFGVLSRAPGTYEWQRADAIADFARAHSMRMTGHTLLWHRMQPAWLFEAGPSAVSRATLGERLREHIFSTVERYADIVDNWDVVNEAISDRSDGFWRQGDEQSNWYEIFGNAEFVDLAFQYAAEAVDRFAPSTKLYYNDYNIEVPEKRGKVIEMLRQLRSRGVRVDGVGIQGHIQRIWPSVDDFGRAIDDFASEQLLVKVSELDVSIYTEGILQTNELQAEQPWTPELERAMTERYVELFKMLLRHAAQLTSVVLWGFSDERSWLNYSPIRRRNFPLLFDEQHRPKAVVSRLLELPLTE